MTLFQDNLSPYLTLVEQGSDPTTPSSGNELLYAKSGGVYVRNHAGTVTGPFGTGGGGSDVVNVATGAGSVTIPGLKGSPDAVPASPSAYDDEFDSLSGWTGLGTLDTSNVTDWPSLWHAVKTTTAGQTLYGIYKTAPTAPFTVTAKVNMAPRTADQQYAAILLAESSPGKLAAFGPLYNSGAPGNNTEFFWSTFSSNGSRSGYVEYTRNAPGFILGELLPHYIRMVVTSSSSVAVAISAGGYQWTTLGTGLDTGLTVANVGLVIGNGGSGTPSAEAAFDWIRFS